MEMILNARASYRSTAQAQAAARQMDDKKVSLCSRAAFGAARRGGVPMLSSRVGSAICLNGIAIKKCSLGHQIKVN